MQKHSRAREAGRKIARALEGAAIRFWRARKGGVALPFALTAVPLSFLVVASMDLHRATLIKTDLQDALDAAALAVGRSTVTTPADVQALGQNSLAANLNSFSNAQLTTASFVLSGDKVDATAEMQVTPLVAGVFGGGPIQLSATSEVVRGENKLEIALVLDNTGSMAGTKLSLLKTAASNFVDTLSEAAARSTDVDPVKIGLVPFSMTVRVGSQYQNASWMDTTGASPINDEIFSSHANRFDLFQQMGVSWAGCVEARQAPYDVQDTAPTSSSPATLFTPFFAPDEPGGETSNSWNGATWYNSYIDDGTNSSSWSTRQGAVAKYNTHALRTGSNAWTGYQYGPNAGCALQPVMRLTTDWTALKSAINGMAAMGDTNIPIGMAWGWRVLSPNAPFADGVPYDTPKTTKVVVMMTDGQNQNTSNYNNNASFYSGDGYIWQNRLAITSGSSSQRQAALDARETAVCANMRAQGIVIYTVRVDVHDNNYAVLQGCASSPDKFYDVQDATQLTSVFNTIADAIQNLRIAH